MISARFLTAYVRVSLSHSGKTSTVTSVVRELAAQSDVPKFDYVEINGMKLPEPDHLYAAMWQQLTGDTVRRSTSEAAQCLTRRFTKSESGRTCVLLLDELDCIGQSVLYTVFEWANTARLIVIGISNTIDLPHSMTPRVRSRMGGQQIHFVPYTTEQIVAIVKNRLAQHLPAFEADAIELCARKIASVSGDVRRALQICQRAADIWEEDQLRVAARSSTPTGAIAVAVEYGMIGSNHVLRAIGDLQNSNVIHHLSHSTTPHDKVLLCGMLTSIKYAASCASGETNPPIPLLDLVAHTERNMDTRGVRHMLAKSQGIRIEDYPTNQSADWLMVAQRWADLGLVALTFQRGNRWPLVQLNVLTDDIQLAFKGDELWNKLQT